MGRVQWTWNHDTNLTNKRHHNLSFETARMVFDDPLAISRPDGHSDGDRWQTIGSVKTILLFVVHT